MEESQSCDPLLREMTHPRRPKQLLRQRLLLVWGLDATAQGLRQNAHGEAPPDKGAVLFGDLQIDFNLDNYPYLHQVHGSWATS